MLSSACAIALGHIIKPPPLSAEMYMADQFQAIFFPSIHLTFGLSTLLAARSPFPNLDTLLKKRSSSFRCGHSAQTRARSPCSNFAPRKYLKNWREAGGEENKGFKLFRRPSHLVCVSVRRQSPFPCERVCDQTMGTIFVAQVKIHPRKQKAEAREPPFVTFVPFAHARSFHATRARAPLSAVMRARRSLLL